MTKIIQVIETYERRGDGTENNPIRLVYQLYTLGGNLIFEKDTSSTKSVTKWEPCANPNCKEEVSSKSGSCLCSACQMEEDNE